MSKLNVKKKKGGYNGGRKEETGHGGNFRYQPDYANGEPARFFGMSKVFNASESYMSEEVVETRHSLGVLGDALGLVSRDGYLTYDPKNKPTRVTKVMTQAPEYYQKGRPHHTTYPKTTHHGKYDNYSDSNTDEDEEEDEEEDEDDASSDDGYYRHAGHKNNKVGYPNHKGGTKPYKNDDSYHHQQKPKSPLTPPHSYITPYYEKPNPYDNEKPTRLGNGYPKLEPYHDKPNPNYYESHDKPNPNYYEIHDKPIPRNGYNIPSYTVPLINQSKRDKSSASNSRPITGNRFQEYPEKGRNSSPIYSSRDNKAYQSQPQPTTIDSVEAKRRYGGVNVPSRGEGNTNDKNKGTIDCKTAAERYNGVLV